MSISVKHVSNLDINKVIEHYSQKDGVEIKYVCTTDLDFSDRPYDIFYRDDPHPKFGNRYFGLGYVNGEMYICNADIIEVYEFGMIQDKQGSWHYSRSRHHYNEIDNENFIDGGRAYIRCNTGYSMFRVKNGEFIHIA